MNGDEVGKICVVVAMDMTEGTGRRGLIVCELELGCLISGLEAGGRFG